MPAPSITLRAGPDALKLLRERGLRAEDVDIVPAASGGAKWLGIAGLDRYLFGEFLQSPRNRPLQVIASSIGSWRMACFAQRDPMAAFARGHHAYIHEQFYSAKPSTHEVSAVSLTLLHSILGATGIDDMLSHPWAHFHIITTECRGMAASERRALLMASVLLAAAGNLVHRRTLAWQMRRFVFHSAGDRTPFAHWTDLPTTHRTLTRDNLLPALMASGSIPLVMEGVRIPGESPRVHRDGGVLDYHLDLDFSARSDTRHSHNVRDTRDDGNNSDGPTNGLVLYPHYYPHIIPGWFDKALHWRRAPVTNFRRALLIAPSDAFVASLPGGKIPDRHDFYTMPRDERVRRWQQAVDASERLGDELRELVAGRRVAEVAEEWV